MQRRRLLLAAGAAVFLSACAVQQINPVSSTQGVSPAKFKEILRKCLLARKWTITDEKPGKTYARFSKNYGKSVAAIIVEYNGDNYKILMDKENTTLIEKDGKVHRKYNQWVATLDADLQRAIVNSKF